MGEATDRPTHLLGMPRIHLALLPRDASRDMLAKIFVAVDPTVKTAFYYIRKTTGVLIPVFGYNETTGLVVISATAFPTYVVGNPTVIPWAGNITLNSAAILNAINAVLRLPNSRPAAPQPCDTRYDPATDTFEIYDGTTWHSH